MKIHPGSPYPLGAVYRLGDELRVEGWSVVVLKKVD